jgi:hypothetical protein
MEPKDPSRRVDLSELSSDLPEPGSLSVEEEAEQRFVDALLGEILTVQASRRQERIAEIVAAVPKRRSRLLRHPGWLSAAAAAVLLALVTLWAVAAEPESLLAFVQKAKAESARAGDRRYELRVQPALGRERVRELYTRGESAFVLRGSFLWGQFVLGRNARQAWLVPPLPRGPVRVLDSPDSWDRILEGQGLDLVTLDARELLQELDPSWQLIELPQPDSTRLQLRADRRAQAGELRRIELEAEAATGKVLRMRAEWGDPDAEQPRRRLELRLVSEDPLPANWFEHRAHHESDRAVWELR